MESTGGRRRARIFVAAAVAALAIAIGLTQGGFLGINAVGPAPGAKPTRAPLVDPLANDRAPRLLTDSIVDVVTPILNQQREDTLTSVQEFWGEGTSRKAEDSSFEDWLTITATAEPSSTQRRSEESKRSDLARSDQNTRAASWLSEHGCKDVWISYAIRDSKGGVGTTVRKELNELLTIATRIASAAQRHANPTAGSAAPCLSTSQPLDAACKCSYPSSATILATAARTYLGARLPKNENKYVAMEQQVAAVGLYQRRELASDVEEGARLGFLLGRYFNITRGYGDESEPTPTATPTR